MQEAVGRHKNWSKYLAGAVGILFLYLAYRVLPVERWSRLAMNYAEANGAFGALMFSVVYIVATLLLFPCAFLTFAAGAMYGYWGIPLVIAASTIGAAIAFMLARHFAFVRVNQMLERRPYTKALRGAIESEGWIFMVLLRVSPLIPFNLNNYLLGVVPVRFSSYIAATIVGALPGTLLYIYFGTFGRDIEQSHFLKWSLFAIGLIGTIILGKVTIEKTKEILSRQDLSTVGEGVL